jgi:nitrite transporter
MPRPITEALTDHRAAAAAKAAQARRPARYLLSSLLAGAYVGVAVVLLLAISGPFAAAGSPATRLVQGAVFGVALTLVVFAGAELFTGNAMVLVQGLHARTVRVRALGRVWALSLIGNLVGSLVFAAMVHGGGTLSPGPGGRASADLLAAVTAGKAAATGPQLLWRAVLCNALVCLALWMAARATSDGARLVVLWWALLAFISSGFEHSVANMTLFGIAALQGSSTWLELGRNLAWTVPGNVIGGALIVGLGYAWLAGPRPAPSADPAPSSRSSIVTAPSAAATATHPSRS